MLQSRRLAYVCYTSGSTGRPKGVAVERCALLAYAEANAIAHGIGPRSRVLLTSAVSFDPCIGEAWTALVAGATLCLPTRAMVKEQLGETVAATRATHICSTPALWRLVTHTPSSLPDLECVALGGERMTAGIIEQWASALRLVNIYGVTECTVYQSSHTVVATSSASSTKDLELQGSLLGAALPGCHLVLLDAELKPILPPSCDNLVEDDERCIGQIAIGGPQLARGYLNKPELTSKVFINASEEFGGRLYLTGDLGRWVLVDGAVVPMLRLIGRVDSQVKLNGMRLELGEVEGVLSNCEPLVRHAAALVIEGRLLAAVEPTCRCFGTKDDEEEEGRMVLLREAATTTLLLHCRRWLPAAVCPSDVMVLDTMPLTPTGKLDRVALRPMLHEWMTAQSSSNVNANGGNTIGGAEPDDPLECAVAAAWCNAIGVPKVGRRSDFVRLGGDSIKALQVSRSLSFSLVHAHAVPPSRGETRRARRRRRIMACCAASLRQACCSVCRSCIATPTFSAAMACACPWMERIRSRRPQRNGSVPPQHQQQRRRRWM